jgi:hypothetical protein
LKGATKFSGTFFSQNAIPTIENRKSSLLVDITENGRFRQNNAFGTLLDPE